ncbi:GspH/FimT family pseudopilin [Sessilibacter sp. MAH2]
MVKKIPYGFSIIELLITLSIASILVAFSIPALNTIYQKNKSATEINRYLSLITFARQTAVANGKYVSVCALDEFDICGQDWSNGVVIFSDDNVNGALDNNEDVYRIFERDSNTGFFTLNASLNSNYINFDPLGTSFRKNISGNLVYCSKVNSTENSRALIFSRSGRVYLAQDNNNNGIPENGSGEDISCG